MSVPYSVNGLNEEDEEEVEVSSADLLRQLEEAWLNEICCPELLPHVADLSDCLISHLSETVDGETRDRDDIEAAIRVMEANRIRFSVAHYLRTRLRKIEQYAFALYEENQGFSSESQSRLSPTEAKYLVEFKQLMEEHIFRPSLNRMPPNVQNTWNVFAVARRAPLDNPVFVRVNETVEDVRVPDPTDESKEEVFDLHRGTQHIIPYSSICSRLKTGEVSLV